MTKKQIFRLILLISVILSALFVFGSGRFDNLPTTTQRLGWVGFYVIFLVPAGYVVVFALRVLHTIGFEGSDGEGLNLVPIMRKCILLLLYPFITLARLIARLVRALAESQRVRRGRLEGERQTRERLENERLEAEKWEQGRPERERLENERIERERQRAAERKEQDLKDEEERIYRVKIAEARAALEAQKRTNDLDLEHKRKTLELEKELEEIRQSRAADRNARLSFILSAIEALKT